MDLLLGSAHESGDIALLSIMLTEAHMGVSGKNGALI